MKEFIISLTILFAGNAFATEQFNGTYQLANGEQTCPVILDIHTDDDWVGVYADGKTDYPTHAFTDINQGTKSHIHDFSKYCYKNVYDIGKLEHFLSDEITPFRPCFTTKKSLQAYIQLKDQALTTYNIKHKKNLCSYIKLNI